MPIGRRGREVGCASRRISGSVRPRLSLLELDQDAVAGKRVVRTAPFVVVGQISFRGRSCIAIKLNERVVRNRARPFAMYITCAAASPITGYHGRFATIMSLVGSPGLRRFRASGMRTRSSPLTHYLAKLSTGTATGRRSPSNGTPRPPFGFRSRSTKQKRCAKSDPAIRKWTIEDSPGWKRLRSR